MATITVRAKIQEFEAVGREGVWSRYIELPRTLKWSHLGSRESWDSLPRARTIRNSPMMLGAAAMWMRNALGLSRDATPRVHIIRHGEPVELPECVTVDESGFLATVRITIEDEHTARRAA